jgi:VWFA-related protein
MATPMAIRSWATLLIVGFLNGAGQSPSPVLSSPQQGPAPPAAPFTSSVEIVSVDLWVFDRDGLPVPDLRLDQVSLTVDGKPRTPVSLQLVRAGSAPRRVVIVVDRDGMPSGEGQPLLAAAARFIDGLLPEDRVASWILPDARGGLQFTTARDPVRAILERSSGSAPRSPSSIRTAPGEVAMVKMGDQRALAAVTARECSRPMLSGSGCPTQVQFEIDRRYSDLEAHARRTLRALRDLIHALGTLDGPKHVLLLSGGIIETPELTETIRDVALSAAAARVHVHAIQLPQNHWVQSAEERAPLTPEWMASAGPSSAASSLAVMTGGFNSTFLVAEPAFSRLARELSASYLLAFEPLPGEKDGRPHRIEVQPKGLRNSSVRARRQFRVPVATERAERESGSTPIGPVARPPIPAESLTTLPNTPPVEPVDPSNLPSLMATVGAYVERFEREFSAVVAEERYVQISKPWTRTPESPDPALLQDFETPPGSRSRVITSRRLRSDLLLVQVPDGLWVAYRDVFEVDGRSVRKRDERVKDLFLSKASGSRDQLRRINHESSRYNLGVATRTVNTPTFPLIYLHPRFQARVRFAIAGRDIIAGRGCVVVEYREVRHPAVVSTSRGADVLAQGRFCVEQSTGRIRMIENRFEFSPTSRAVLQVGYEEHPILQMLVPTSMWEWYQGGAARLLSSLKPSVRRPGDPYIECFATYSNFRRFSVDTTERAKPPR